MIPLGLVERRPLGAKPQPVVLQPPASEDSIVYSREATEEVDLLQDKHKIDQLILFPPAIVPMEEQPI